MRPVMVKREMLIIFMWETDGRERKLNIILVCVNVNENKGCREVVSFTSPCN